MRETYLCLICVIGWSCCGRHWQNSTKCLDGSLCAAGKLINMLNMSLFRLSSIDKIKEYTNRWETFIVTWKMAYFLSLLKQRFLNAENKCHYTNTRDVMSNYLKRNVTSGRAGGEGLIVQNLFKFTSLAYIWLFSLLRLVWLPKLSRNEPKIVHRFKLELFFEPRNSQILSPFRLFAWPSFFPGSLVTLYSAVSVKMTIFLRWLGFQALQTHQEKVNS